MEQEKSGTTKKKALAKPNKKPWQSQEKKSCKSKNPAHPAQR
jgi:hypothetical protein